MVPEVLKHPLPLGEAHPRLRLAVTSASFDPEGVCRLAQSVEAGRIDDFPRVASAVIGTLVHEVIEEAVLRGRAAIPDPAAALAARCNAWDLDPKGGIRWPQLVPLRRYVVDGRRRDALATIAAGLAHIGRGYEPQGGPAAVRGPNPAPSPWVEGRWPEYDIEDHVLGLKGSIDLLKSDGRGRLTVLDYKTGFDQDAEDQQEKRATYHRQVQIYLLMLSRIHPDATLGGKLLGSHGEDEVPWTEEIAARIVEHLDAVRAAMIGAGPMLPIPSEDSCRFCRIRHRCPAFRPWVEACRAEKGQEFLAGNVWGIVRQPPQEDVPLTSLSIQDDSGAVFVLNGLVYRQGYQRLVAGAQISAYGFRPEWDSELRMKPKRLWERRSSGRSICASALIYDGHPISG
jgi:PD-(D/E)XK nuclease superfamily